ncbi:hypothetical protein JCM10003_40 [Bacteroides pyogenes JCM 10003]|nr:hypothetical protein JCM10003_40 [Bacteroides pyogenes JCM 10003]
MREVIVHEAVAPTKASRTNSREYASNHLSLFRITKTPVTGNSRFAEKHCCYETKIDKTIYK